MSKHKTYRTKHKARIEARLLEKGKTVDPFSEGFEPIFKVELPISPIKNGFGYEGVVVRDKSTDEIQCHICGKFYNHLGQHVLKAHKTPARVYKKNYGLPLGYAMVSKATSKRLSESATLTNNARNLTPVEASAKAKVARKDGEYLYYYKNNASFHNKLGICNKQLDSRYLVCCFMVGRLAKPTDMLALDKPLLPNLRKRGHTEARRKDLWESAKGKKPNEYYIAILRNYYRLTSKRPHIKDIKQSKEILKRYGSWDSALIHSGFERIA